MSEEKSIKETKEAIAAAKLASFAVKHIIKGGVAAIPAELLALAPKYGVFVDAYQGADQIKAELQDLEKAEIIELFVSIFDGIKEFEQA